MHIVNTVSVQTRLSPYCIELHFDNLALEASIEARERAETPTRVRACIRQQQVKLRSAEAQQSESTLQQLSYTGKITVTMEKKVDGISARVDTSSSSSGADADDALLALSLSERGADKGVEPTIRLSDHRAYLSSPPPFFPHAK
ncbi:hypothetical protein E1301_Tti014147 [Triplophysa tibetana]|uniref:Uncharacterized protein n=1 Tax=Triplophysa tibetana TaxID=1572043 RepID=A0A5A9PPQ3_9TELE|nr:hypothetical protein E1301_Tti014147 [Triplophysa tibetana]